MADDVDPATTLRTEFETSLSFEQAAAFVFYPEEWTCFPFWCDMRQEPPENGKRYREIVSFDCVNKDRALTFVVDLDFRFRTVPALPDGPDQRDAPDEPDAPDAPDAPDEPYLAVAEYRLSAQ